MWLRERDQAADELKLGGGRPDFKFSTRGLHEADLDCEARINEAVRSFSCLILKPAIEMTRCMPGGRYFTPLSI